MPSSREIAERLITDWRADEVRNDPPRDSDVDLRNRIAEALDAARAEGRRGGIEAAALHLVDALADARSHLHWNDPMIRLIERLLNEVRALSQRDDRGEGR